MRGPALVLLALVLAAPHPLAGQGPAAPDAENDLRDRVTRYWEARGKLNLVAAHSFYEPEFRAEYPLEQFLSLFQRLLRFRPEFRGIDRVQIEPDGRSARVWVGLRIKPAELNGEALDTLNEETWFLMDGVWYRQREALIPNI